MAFQCNPGDTIQVSDLIAYVETNPGPQGPERGPQGIQGPVGPSRNSR